MYKLAPGKIIDVRLVNSFKGDTVKSRLVVQEFATRCGRDDIFAATPPLIASKFVLSDTAFQEKRGAISRRLCVMDV